MRRILVPLDGTPLGEAVLPRVAEIARATGAEVHLLHVVPPRASTRSDAHAAPRAFLGAPTVPPNSSPSAAVLGSAYDPVEIAATGKYVERVGVWLRGEGVDARTEVVEGLDVAAEILRQSCDADLLAFAASTAPRAWGLVGFGQRSISERLLRDGTVAMLFVRVANADG